MTAQPSAAGKTSDGSPSVGQQCLSAVAYQTGGLLDRRTNSKYIRCLESFARVSLDVFREAALFLTPHSEGHPVPRMSMGTKIKH